MLQSWQLLYAPPFVNFHPFPYTTLHNIALHYPLLRPAFSQEVFADWGEFLRLGIPGALSLLLEWWDWLLRLPPYIIFTYNAFFIGISKWLSDISFAFPSWLIDLKTYHSFFKDNTLKINNYLHSPFRGSFELAASIAVRLGTVSLAVHGIYASTASIFYMIPQVWAHIQWDWLTAIDGVLRKIKHRMKVIHDILCV